MRELHNFDRKQLIMSMEDDTIKVKGGAVPGAAQKQKKGAARKDQVETDSEKMIIESSKI